MPEAFEYFGDHSTKEIQKFVALLDRFFDCLNVRSLNEWAVKWKPDLKAYFSTDDTRLQVVMYFTCQSDQIFLCVSIHIVVERSFLKIT